jgi:predicted NUDIX family phosphoesterase
MPDQDLQESVLVVPRAVVDELCPRVFGRANARVKPAILAQCRFLERSIAEHDFSHKQVIPYVVVRHADRYLLLQRTARQTEARLHNLYSLGVGGHINNEDTAPAGGDIITAGMRRDLSEEVEVLAEESCELIGLINDDSTEVARVHMGLIYLLSTTSPDFRIVEKDKHIASWKTADELSLFYDQMESWAKIVHDFVLFADAGDPLKKWAVPA